MGICSVTHTLGQGVLPQRVNINQQDQISRPLHAHSMIRYLTPPHTKDVSLLPGVRIK